MLTDEMFGVKKNSLTDQLFANSEGDLTDQLFPKETPPPTPITEAPKAKPKGSVFESPLFKETLLGQEMKAYFKPSKEEVTWTDEPLHEATKKALVDIGKTQGENVLAAGELAMNLASSMILYIPSKLYGVMALPYGREVANIAEEEIARLGYQPYTESGQRSAELIGKGFELFLTPARNVGEEVSKLNPEAGYLVEFGAELAEFAITGGIVRGAKAKFKPKIESARRVIDAKNRLEKEAIDQQIKEVEGIPNDIVRETQRKILENEKIQADLRYKQALDNFAKNAEPLVKEELGRKAEEVARAKTYPIEKSGLKKPKKPIELKEAEVKQPELRYEGEQEGLGSLYTVMEGPEKGGTFSVKALKEKGIKAEERGKKIEPKVEYSGEVIDIPKGSIDGGLDIRYDGVQENTGYQWTDMDTKSTFYTKTKNFDDVFERVNEVRKRFEEVEEPTTGLDLETGTREPIQLSTNKSPFRETPEVTEQRTKLFNDVKWQDDVELATGKLINDFNKWLDTGEGDPTTIRNTLSEFAARAEELKSEFMESEDYPSNFDNWKEMVSEAASWARKGRRGDGGTKLYSGIPVDLISKEIKGSIKMGMNYVSVGFRKYILSPKVQKFVEDRAKDFATEKGIEFWDTYLEKMPNESNRLVFRYFDDKNDRFIEMKSVYGTRLGSSDIKLYDIGGATAEGAKQIVEAAKRGRDYILKARGMKTFKPKEAAKLLKEELKRNFVDRSGNIRVELLDKAGQAGYEVLQKMYLSKGASSISTNMLKQMQKEVYRGLSGNEKRILDSLIFHKRMTDIAQYKTPKQFKYFEKHPVDESIAYTELVGQIEKISPEKVADLHRRAETYFEWMKRPLKDMYESGLIAENEFNLLSSHNYRKLKLVDIFDKRYQAKLGKRKRTVYDSGVESLARGRDTDIFEPSSEVMALEVFNRAYGRVMNNEANKTLLDLARKDPENPFVRVKETKDAKIPTGWNRIFMYEEGQRKSLYLSPEMSKEWIINNPEISYRLSQILRYASGSPVLRTFATGINWGFALANLPRDIMHTWFTARTWENGEWKGVYSPHAPVFAMQIGRDLLSVFGDAALRKGRYEKYINEGGGMEFMVHQGRILQRGRHLEGPIDKVNDFLGYFGETSEIMTRLAIRERVLRKGKSPQEATFAARDYMDFGQGGGIAKAMDNAIPYLNASIQGTRGMFRAFKENPIASTYKLSQFAALVTGIYVAMNSRSPETKKNLQGSLDMTNNLVIPLGDEFGFVDDEGQTRYPYIKIPLDPGQRFFKKFFEASTDKWLGNEVDVEGTIDALNELTPVSVSGLPPTLSGTLGYLSNKDFWLNEDIWKKSEPFSYPSSKEEYTSRTPQAFIDVGKATGLSPDRLKYAVEELVTSGTVWSYLLGQGYDELFGDMPKEKKEQHLAMVLSKMPVAKRFIGVTNPYSKYATKIDKAQEEAVLKDFVENRNFDIKVEGYLYGEGVSRQDVVKEANQYKDREIYDRLMDRFKFEEAIKTLPEKSFWRRMKGLRMEAKAKVFVDRLKSANEKEKEQLWKEYGIVSRAKGVISPEFRQEVSRLMGRE